MEVTFKINVPSWMGTWVATAKYAVASFRWILNPCRCRSCNKRVASRQIRFEQKSPRLVVEDLLGTAPICAECLLSALDLPYASTYEDRYNRKPTCNICGEKKISYKIFQNEKCKVHYCTNSWNSSYVCLDCAKQAIVMGDLRTGRAQYANGKWVQVNSHGLVINTDGTPKLFRQAEKISATYRQ